MATTMTTALLLPMGRTAAAVARNEARQAGKAINTPAVMLTAGCDTIKSIGAKAVSVLRKTLARKGNGIALDGVKWFGLAEDLAQAASLAAWEVLKPTIGTAESGSIDTSAEAWRQALKSANAIVYSESRRQVKNGVISGESLARPNLCGDREGARLFDMIMSRAAEYGDEGSIEAAEFRADYARAVASLNPLNLEAFSMWVEGYSQRDIAARYGVSQTAVVKWLDKARKHLRELLQKNS